MSERGFFSRMLGGGTDEDQTRIYRLEEIGERMSREEEEEPQGFTAERAARVIDDLPSDVSPESAVRIVRATLAAVGVKIEDLERSTRMRESKLGSEIEFARNRQNELRERAEEVVRSLEEDMRKAQEACDNGIAEEEVRISHASAALESIRRVRAFFGFPRVEEEKPAEPAGDSPGDETQILEPLDRTQEASRPPDPVADTNGANDTTSENPPPYRKPYGTDKR